MYLNREKNNTQSIRFQFSFHKIFFNTLWSVKQIAFANEITFYKNFNFLKFFKPKKIVDDYLPECVPCKRTQDCWTAPSYAFLHWELCSARTGIHAGLWAVVLGSGCNLDPRRTSTCHATAACPEQWFCPITVNDRLIYISFIRILFRLYYGQSRKTTLIRMGKIRPE